MSESMDGNVVEVGSTRECACGSGTTLAVLQDVQRAYQQRLALIDKMGGPNKQQKQIEILQSWVTDVVAQNSLMARTIEDLEKEATSRLLKERVRNNEPGLDLLNCQYEDIMHANDALKKDNLEKEREIRRLVKEMDGHKQKIDTLLNELSLLKEFSHYSKHSVRDCGNNTDICCDKKDMDEKLSHGRMLHDEAHRCEERIHDLELTLKSSCDNVRALRKVNVALSEELHAMRRVCTALDEQCRAATLRSHFKDDIIREMRRQLKQAKIKLRESETASTKSMLRAVDEELKCQVGASYGSVSSSATSTRSRRRRRITSDAPLHPESEDDHSAHYAGSGDDVHVG